MNGGVPLKATLMAGVVSLAAIAVQMTPAQAAEGRNAAAIAGAVGGFAAGAVVGSAAAQPRYYAAPVRERRVIVEEDDDEECVVRTRRVYVNGVMRTRRVTVCE
jgi:outer membrane lipoprotein SlyB